MIKITNSEVFNIQGAFRGLRNPLNSWNQSDSYTDWDVDIGNYYKLGEKDITLAQRMIKGGTDESKFLRQILVSVDITTNLAHWKELDTYKVATVANSCSTMHTIHKTPITPELFSMDFDEEFNFIEEDTIKAYFSMLDNWREQYVENKDKDAWRKLIMFLPESFNQKRTWTANYQVLRNIYFARRHHKLKEWHTFCEWIESLPYARELICYDPKEEKENE